MKTMMKTIENFPVTVSVPYMKDGDVYKEMIDFDISIDGNRFMAKQKPVKRSAGGWALKIHLLLTLSTIQVFLVKKPAKSSLK